jgi:hypothetical protein
MRPLGSKFLSVNWTTCVPKLQVYDISENFEFEEFEQLGTKAKHWMIDGAGNKFLFKQGREKTGENWAEVVAFNIASKLEMPCAGYHLAIENGIAGVLSNSFVPKDGRLIHGNELIGNISSNPADRRKRHSMRQHVLSTVRALTKTLPSKPLGWDSFSKVKSAEEIFCGYLMLDALIANQDRHYENWGYILTNGQTIHLAPTFDHASSLGRNEQEESMKIRLSTKDKGRSLEHYVTKAKSALFKSRGDMTPMTTIDAFDTWGAGVPLAKAAWIERLAGISDIEFRDIIESIPDELISETAVEFTHKLLILNKQRIIDTGTKTT